MNQTEEDRRWQRFADWLRKETERRGGTAYVNEWAVNLAPPNRRAGQLHITRSDDGFATVETGFAIKTMETFLQDEDDEPSARAVVSSIMDGRAWEYADADGDGTWIATRFFIPFAGGSVGSDTPRGRPGVASVAQTFARRIPAWDPADVATGMAVRDDEESDTGHGGLRFLSLEEAVRLGVTDEDGNFLDDAGRA